MDNRLAYKDWEVREKAVLEGRTLHRSGKACVLGPFATCILESRRTLVQGDRETRHNGGFRARLGLQSSCGERGAPVTGLEFLFPQPGDEGRQLTLCPGATVSGMTENLV